MISLNTLKANDGAVKHKVRVGRGQGSGNGCTAGKGNNGAHARSGATHKLYFEGGQTPLTRRIPKRGFTNPFKLTYQIVNVGDLQGLEETEIDAEVLYKNGLIHDKDRPVKILGNGEITRSVNVKAEAFSKTAREKLKMANS
jgi:large subunit ribosomal protein L15